MKITLCYLMLCAVNLIAGAPDYFSSIDVEKAWQITRGDPNVKVAVISTGINHKIPELEKLICKNPGESGEGREQDGIDNDGNGYVDDVLGVNLITNSNDPQDDNGLGSHNASVIASQNFGIAPLVTIIPIAVTNANGSGTKEATLRAIEYAAQRGADIIHLSVGGYQSAQDIENFCHVVRNVAIPVFAVAGNEGRALTQSSGHLPADCNAENLFIVASATDDGRLFHASNFGENLVDIASLGVNIPGYLQDGTIKNLSGTSVAAATAAGVAALVKSVRPSITARELKSLLISSSVETPALRGKVTSGGLINAFNAVLRAAQ